ncbi:MAG: alpha/beta hydrolase [Gammaproteobacteria bacterium]|nr:alpha/beta hydrolase [Gammaproteobacteria bacterium]
MIKKQTTSRTDGEDLAYWVQHAPDPQAPWLVVLHGGASNHTRWSEYVDNSSLAACWNILAPDLRGNGASMTRKHLNMATWCADIEDLLAAEGAKSALVAGHSLGAQIAVHFAHRSPDLVDGLVLIDPIFQAALQGRSLTVWRYRWLVQAATKIILGLNALGIRRSGFAERDLRALDQETRKAIAEADSFAEIAERYSAVGPILANMPTANYLRQGLATISPLPDLGGISAPVLALLSGASTVGNVELNKAQIRQFPNSHTIILNANHWPLTETPEQVREAIDGWVNTNWPISS